MSKKSTDFLSSLEVDLPPEVYRDIDMVFQAWALFEATLTEWLIALLKVDDDIGRLVIDRFDTRAKLDRIKEIYAHSNNLQMVQTAKEASKNFEKHIKVRNILAHKVRQGITPDKKELYFWTGKPVLTKSQEMEMIGFNIDALRKSALFAAGTAKQISKGLAVFRE